GPATPVTAPARSNVPLSRYHARPAGDDRPLVTTSIATVTTDDSTPHATPATPAASHRNRTPPRQATPALTRPAVPPPDTDPTAPDQPSHRPAPTATDVLDLLRGDPHRAWHSRDIARILHVTNINSFRTRMSQWARQGLLHKTDRATYTLTSNTLDSNRDHLTTRP
ncbi:hypothetical protein FrEUN1fDRAFT_4095, partial [Parafrankia sp. EUN1f]